MKIEKINSSSCRIKYGLFDFPFYNEIYNMLEFVNSSDEHYKSCDQFNGLPVIIVPITQITHKIRKDGVPIFNDGIDENTGESLTGKERALRILSGFENGEKLPPIILYRKGVDEWINFFHLKDGCHRLHCSIAYGYKKIPAIIGEHVGRCIDNTNAPN